MATTTQVGVEIPAKGTWKMDPGHTIVGAVARHLMVTKVRGRFRVFEGVIQVADTPEESAVEITIDAASIDTGSADRDTHLRSPDFLDVQNHPTVAFRSTNVQRTGDTTLRVTGDLTIRGTTRPIVLDVEYDGLVEDPWGGKRAAFTVRGELEREAWGMTWNVALEKGGVLVSKKLQLEIEVQAVRSAEEAELASEAEAELTENDADQIRVAS